jgi:molybdopterin molybdotransferase
MALLPVEEARARILGGVRPLPLENVALAEALGRVLARDLKARRDQPPFAASAMDGYAVRAVDVSSVPARLRVVGQAPAGRGFGGVVQPGEAVRIFTGAPIPQGADAIVIQENAEPIDGDVLLKKLAKPGQHIRVRGLDFKRGEPLLRAPLKLSPRALGLAASMNYATLRVRQRPIVAIMATGDELVEPGNRPNPDQIVSSNSFALCGLVATWGGEAGNLGIVRDDLKATARAVRGARQAHVLVTTGGASVGEHDFVRQALQSEGYRLGFWKIAMRPGKPLMFATGGRQRVLGLPGNPVSAIVCARLFLKPLIDALLGIETPEELCTARLGAPLPPNDERQDYLRARLEQSSGAMIATPYSVQDSSMQRLMAEADALIVRPPFQAALAAGESVNILPLDF